MPDEQTAMAAMKAHYRRLSIDLDDVVFGVEKEGGCLTKLVAFVPDGTDAGAHGFRYVVEG